jgi:hypothetical protein
MDKRKTNGGTRDGAGRPTVRNELKGVDLANPHIDDAFKTLAEILNNKEENSRDRITAAKILIEYGCGKPKETIETTHNVNNFDIKDLFKVDKSKE